GLEIAQRVELAAAIAVVKLMAHADRRIAAEQAHRLVLHRLDVGNDRNGARDIFLPLHPAQTERAAPADPQFPQFSFTAAQRLQCESRKRLAACECHGLAWRQALQNWPRIQCDFRVARRSRTAECEGERNLPLLPHADGIWYSRRDGEVRL